MNQKDTWPGRGVYGGDWCAPLEAHVTDLSFCQYQLVGILSWVKIRVTGEG